MDGLSLYYTINALEKNLHLLAPPLDRPLAINYVVNLVLSRKLYTSILFTINTNYFNTLPIAIDKNDNNLYLLNFSCTSSLMLYSESRNVSFKKITSSALISTSFWTSTLFVLSKPCVILCFESSEVLKTWPGKEFTCYNTRINALPSLFTLRSLLAG